MSIHVGKTPPIFVGAIPIMSKNSDAWFRLTQIVATVEAELGKALQVEHGLGLSEYRALEALSRSADSELRMQELAAHLHLNQSSVSRMAERLEREGLAIRDLCPDDKRGVYTVLTDKGRARFENARSDFERTLNAALGEGEWEELLSARLVARGD
ncbi:MarR family transcriptional regulator [Nitratireductor indicus C115]|uniref:MarR family transcriptional regulator n=2 Tax=Nitratireductor indicus TaxID=721133 RepID=K2PHG0_9HYPH|nr:MarR family transcriptional regulator [Nitratireductor indicus C115]SFQ49206.1 DNA-binding transcriptional regulator, MarR family [Nitratireductor indicus]